MKKSLLVLIVLGAFTLAGCVPPPEGTDETNTNNNVNSSEVTDADSDADSDGMMEETDDDSMMEDDSDGMMEADGGASDGYAAYQNKAVGYSVQRPENWYWRHYIKGEIESINPNVDDFLLISRGPIGSLATEIPAPIVIEVSQQPLNTFADSVSSLSSSKVTVGGEETSRYEGVRNDMKAIEYQFTHNGRTYRLIYTAPEGLTEQEQVFETIVKSFTFTS